MRKNGERIIKKQIFIIRLKSNKPELINYSFSTLKIKSNQVSLAHSNLNLVFRIKRKFKIFHMILQMNGLQNKNRLNLGICVGKLQKQDTLKSLKQ